MITFVTKENKPIYYGYKGDIFATFKYKENGDDYIIARCNEKTSPRLFENWIILFAPETSEEEKKELTLSLSMAWISASNAASDYVKLAQWNW